MNKLLFGVAYYDEYMPYDRIDVDMDLIKAAGMNVIRIAESTWATWEPEDGVYDFTHLHRMLDAAKRHGIKVIIGTPTYAIPAWLAKKYPDILAVTKNGQNLYGPRQNIDITNKDYLFHAERIVRKLLEEVKDSDVVIGYQLDNETRSAGAAGPDIQKAFVESLKEKYPDINDFNLEFGLDYWSNRIGCWEDFPDVRGTINQSLDAAYRAFLRDKITEFLMFLSDIVNEYRRPDQFITHNFDYEWRDYSYGIQPEVDQYSAAAAVTVAGVDIYHPSGPDLTGREIAFGGSVGRSLKKDNYLVLETQSQGRIAWQPYPGQLRLQAYSHLGSGAGSVMYWNWHSIHNAIESYWKGILSHNLGENSIYREIQSLGHEMARIEDHLYGLKKDCKVAMLVDNRSLTGMDEFIQDTKLSYNDVVRDFYDACYDMNIEVDMLSVNDSFLSYPMLIVPALYSVDDNTIDKLRSYVAFGGTLLMSYRSCFADEELKIFCDDQPYGLTDVFGMTYDRFTIARGDSGITINGKDYELTDWMEFLEPKDCKVIATYNHKYYGNYAAITENSYATGKAVYLGCRLPKEALMDIIRDLAEDADIDIPPFSFPVIVKKGINSLGENISYIYNYSSEEAVIASPYDDCHDILTGTKYNIGDPIRISDWDLVILVPNPTYGNDHVVP